MCDRAVVNIARRRCGDVSRRPFWKKLRRFVDISENSFLDPRWQSRFSVAGTKRVASFLLEEEGCRDVARDFAEGIAHHTMSQRMTPYILSRMNISNLRTCPVRKQFIPLAGDDEKIPSHPMLTARDSLDESGHSPVPGVVHRYPEKALLLATNSCPTYCRFCTRSYGVGKSTDLVEKSRDFVCSPKQWNESFDYLTNTKEGRRVRDVVVSGGDAGQLSASQIRYIGRRLLEMPHVERVRFATKVLSVMPMKVLGDPKWVSALADLNEYARQHLKQISIQTHINHPNEISWVTRDAMRVLHGRHGIVVRNQTVLLKGVNDDARTILTLIKSLSSIQIQPYYVYLHDLVPGTEDLRTPLSTMLAIEETIRGTVAGFNSPQFIVDLAGGGGKRLASTFCYYSEETGISVFRSPLMKRDNDDDDFYLHFDPLRELTSDSCRRAWSCPRSRRRMIQNALSTARERAL